MKLDCVWNNVEKVGDQRKHAVNTEVFTGNFSLDNICQRLEGEIPHGWYIDHETFAQLIGVSTKTLANKRAMHPEKFPAAIYFAGSKSPRFARRDIIKWLAQEEYNAKKIHKHNCL